MLKEVDQVQKFNEEFATLISKISSTVSSIEQYKIVLLGEKYSPQILASVQNNYLIAKLTQKHAQYIQQTLIAEFNNAVTSKN